MVNENIPQNLYYNLTPLYEGAIPPAKEQIARDTIVIGGNEIEVSDSGYNGKQTISVGATNSFTYTLSAIPERASYISTSSDLKYTTDSATAYGAIAEIKIFDGGENYYSLPGITTITSGSRKNAVAEVSSKVIGQINKTKIDNIGYNFPTDNTLRPSVGLPQLITIDNHAKIKSIGISSVGRGYSVAPSLIVFDGITRVRDEDIALDYTLGDSQVTILKNTKGISNTPPVIPDIAAGINILKTNTHLVDPTP